MSSNNTRVLSDTEYAAYLLRLRKWILRQLRYDPTTWDQVVAEFTGEDWQQIRGRITNWRVEDRTLEGLDKLATAIFVAVNPEISEETH